MYKAHPIEAPNIHKSPVVKLRFSNKFTLAFMMINITPIKQINIPTNCLILNLSLKNIDEITMIKIGDDV